MNNNSNNLKQLIMNKLFTTIAIALITLTSCTKESNGVDDITTSTETINRFANGVESLSVVQSNNTSSRNALQTTVVTINGQEQTLELNRDNFYDDAQDNLVHLSQEYTIDLVAETIITTTLDDSTGNIIETEQDVTNTFRVYFNILIDTNTNAIYSGTESNIIVTNLNQDYSFTVGLNADDFNISLPSVSYNDGSTVLSLAL